MIFSQRPVVLRLRKLHTCACAFDSFFLETPFFLTDFSNTPVTPQPGSQTILASTLNIGRVSRQETPVVHQEILCVTRSISQTHIPSNGHYCQIPRPGAAAKIRGRYHGGRRPPGEDSFHIPAVIPPSALDKPSIMKRYRRRQKTR